MDSTFSTSHLLICEQPFRPAVETFIGERWNIDVKTYPHTVWFGEEGESIKIATVRDLQENLSFAQSAEHPRYIIILGIDTATIPAQNALLKVVEEPPANTQLILVGKSLNSILPTIQSRCILNGFSEEIDTTKTKEMYHSLRTANIPTTLTLAEEYTDRATAQAMAVSLIRALHEQLENDPSPQLAVHVQTVLKLKERLEKNCNVQLVVEEAFLQLRQ